MLQINKRPDVAVMQPAYQRRKCRTRPFFQRLSIMASCFRKLGGERTEPDNGRQKTHKQRPFYFIWPTKLCSKKKLLDTWKPSNREIFQLLSRWSLRSMKKRYRCFSILSRAAWYRRGRVCVRGCNKQEADFLLETRVRSETQPSLGERTLTATC